MAQPAVHLITAMPRASLLHEGSVAELHFKTHEGPDLILAFDVAQLERFAVRAHQMSVLDRIQKATKSGHLEVHGTGVAAALAQAGIGGKSVTLMVRTTQREVIPYSLTLDQARELQTVLAEAIGSAEKDAGQTRQ